MGLGGGVVSTSRLYYTLSGQEWDSIEFDYECRAQTNYCYLYKMLILLEYISVSVS
jgi:hypothetical protein